MKKTDFASFCNTDVCKGCKYCIKGEKLVLFIGGKCSRNCWYCSLSKNRKNSNICYANERPINSAKDLITEAIENNSKGAGITGGDPLLYFNLVKKYAKALKSKFGRKFHIHIYLPPSLVNEKRLTQLKEFIDEIRFHPSFLINNSTKLKKQEIEKIKQASSIFGKQNIGIELPCIPEKKQEIFNFIKDISGDIGFCNLNEFEISETNFEKITKNYILNSDTYTISGSIAAGKYIIEECEKLKLPILVHLCTAKTKDSYQFINRLLRHKILPFGKRTNEGTVIYFAVYPKNLNETKDIENIIKKITKEYYIDKEKNRIIINIKQVEKVYNKTKLKIARVEEHPTFNSDYLEFGYIDE